MKMEHYFLPASLKDVLILRFFLRIYAMRDYAIRRYPYYRGIF